MAPPTGSAHLTFIVVEVSSNTFRSCTVGRATEEKGGGRRESEVGGVEEWVWLLEEAGSQKRRELTGCLGAHQGFTADLVQDGVDPHRVLGQRLEALQDHGAQGAVQLQLETSRAPVSTASTDSKLWIASCWVAVASLARVGLFYGFPSYC